MTLHINRGKRETKTEPETETEIGGQKDNNRTGRLTDGDVNN